LEPTCIIHRVSIENKYRVLKDTLTPLFLSEVDAYKKGGLCCGLTAIIWCNISDQLIFRKENL